jgi:hypothetical protein
MRPSKLWTFGPALLLVSLGVLISHPAWAGETTVPSPLDLRRLKWGFAGFGLLFGFFLSYSIRSGSKTQDVFKSLTGVLGAGGGTATAALIGEPYRITALGAYTLGASAGFAIYVFAALVLVTVFAAAESAKKKKWAEVLGRVILGEEFSPPPKPGLPAQGGGQAGAPGQQAHVP